VNILANLGYTSTLKETIDSFETSDCSALHSHFCEDIVPKAGERQLLCKPGNAGNVCIGRGGEDLSWTKAYGSPRLFNAKVTRRPETQNSSNAIAAQVGVYQLQALALRKLTMRSEEKMKADDLAKVEDIEPEGGKCE
jgi:hypothetical protein